MQLSQLTPAIKRCLELNIPMAVFAYPGEDDYIFLSSMPHPTTGENELTTFDGSRAYFEIDFFNHDNSYPVGVTDMLSPGDIAAIPASFKPLPGADIFPQSKSTPYIIYAAQLHEIVKRLPRSGAKTVLSRVIAGQSGTTDIAAICEEYFAAYPDTCRYIFFTQETGLWIGATPELLLDYDYATGTFTTVSLAGTRPVCDGPWDDKNIGEHDIVTSFINACLNDAGATDIHISPLHNKRFGQIEHLCTEFTGKYGGDPRDLIYRLSPTPAVAGYPRDKALLHILTYETHNRHCYAGHIVTVDPAARRLRAFVNLRCAFLATTHGKTLYNIYAGGGLVKKSTAPDEWDETQAKSSLLQSLLK